MKTLASLFLVIALFVPSIALADISQDAVTAFSGKTGTSPFAFNHTNGASADYLLVFVLVSGNIVTGVTYNGTSMAQLKFGSASFNPSLYIYGLAAPGIGTASVSISYSGGSQVIEAGSISLIGAKQTGQPDAVGTVAGTGNGSSLTTDITTVADGSWVYALTGNDSSANSSASTGSTLVTGGSGTGRLSPSVFKPSTDNPVTPAGAKSLTASYGSNVGAEMISVSIAPASFSPPVTFFKLPDIIWWGFNALGL